DMEKDTGKSFNPSRSYELWNAAFQQNGEVRPEYLQVISPYHAELFGIDHINAILQRHAQGRALERYGSVAGITVFDKVIQIINRSKSTAIAGFNTQSRKPEKLDIFNGELGFVKISGFDKEKARSPFFRLSGSGFQVVFSRKAHFWANYKSSEV